MSCLNCVSAHRRGRFWFCNRCGAVMRLRLEPAPVIPLGRRSTGELADLPDADVLDLDQARRTKHMRR
jgi:hypothetical protein